eukprot:RCo045888
MLVSSSPEKCSSLLPRTASDASPRREGEGNTLPPLFALVEEAWPVYPSLPLFRLLVRGLPVVGSSSQKPSPPPLPPVKCSACCVYIPIFFLCFDFLKTF